MDKMTREEWLAWRKVGASDAAVILGLSPYKTLYQLWEEKVSGVEQPDNAFMAYGRKREAVILEDIREKWGEIQTDIKISHPDHFFLTATLDALVLSTGEIIEIKAPQSKAFYAMVEEDKIPLVYQCQMQHQMLVHGSSSAIFACENPDTKELWVKRLDKDPEFEKKYVPLAAKFWECVEKKTAPDLVEKDKSRLENGMKNSMQSSRWEELSLHLRQIKQEMAVLKKIEDDLKEEVLALCGNAPAEGFGLSVSVFSREGSIDWKRAKADGLDVEKYRKEGTSGLMITVK
jgi:putative phage-type endonuclease